MKKATIYKPVVAEITQEQFDSGIIDIDLAGAELIRIEEQTDGHWEVTNAMNGYGYNTREEYIGAKVEFSEE